MTLLVPGLAWASSVLAQATTTVPPGPDAEDGATDTGTGLLGPNFLEFLVLALGAALVVGNVLALVRPPARREQGDLRRAPVGRSLVMAGIGLIAVVWSFATLVAG
jgi:hypothetical protein